MRVYALIVATWLGCLSTAHAKAPSPHVFRIVATECGGAQPSRILSGFRIADYSGILTALHGVLSCKSIHAESEGGPKLTKAVALVAYNLAHDVALLASDETNWSVGLKTAQPSADAPGTVRGYPLGLNYQIESMVRVRDPAVRLATLVPPASYQSLKLRGSPDVEKLVVSIEGHLTVGHSGAPLLNANGAAFAMANGGLERGVHEINWAVPVLPRTALTSVEATSHEPALTSLQSGDAAGLFSFAEDFDPGDIVTCFDKEFVPVRRIAVAELAASVDDPLTYQQLLYAYGLNGLPLEVTLYRDRLGELSLAVPHRWAVIASDEECRLRSDAFDIEVSIYLQKLKPGQIGLQAQRWTSQLEYEQFCERGYIVDPGGSNVAARPHVERGLMARRKSYTHLDRRCPPYLVPPAFVENIAWKSLPVTRRAPPGPFQCSAQLSDCGGQALPAPDQWPLMSWPASVYLGLGFASMMYSSRAVLAVVARTETDAARYRQCELDMDESSECRDEYRRKTAWGLAVLSATATSLTPAF